MKNILVDIKSAESLPRDNGKGDLGELLLPKLADDSFPKKINEDLEILRRSSGLLNFTALQRENCLWCVDVVYCSKDSQVKHAQLTCTLESEYALQISGRTFFFKKLENALAELLKGNN